MKLISQKTVDFPSIGRVVKKGEFEATEEESKIFLTNPYITIKQEKNGTQSKTRMSRNRS